MEPETCLITSYNFPSFNVGACFIYQRSLAYCSLSSRSSASSVRSPSNKIPPAGKLISSSFVLMTTTVLSLNQAFSAWRDISSQSLNLELYRKTILGNKIYQKDFFTSSFSRYYSLKSVTSILTKNAIEPFFTEISLSKSVNCGTMF